MLNNTGTLSWHTFCLDIYTGVCVLLEFFTTRIAFAYRSLECYDQIPGLERRTDRTARQHSKLSPPFFIDWNYFAKRISRIRYRFFSHMDILLKAWTNCAYLLPNIARSWRVRSYCVWVKESARPS